MATAEARHILVETEEVCNDLKAKIEAGAAFAEVAEELSACPSGASGGPLGAFGPGQMVNEVETVLCSAELGCVHGPVQTQFGYHPIEITKRTD